MGRITYSTVFGLLLLQFTYCAKPVFDEGHQWMYEYNSNILTKNAVSDEHIAEWTVSGNLIVQSIKDHIVLKLDNLKTSAFNGFRSNKDDATVQNIPAEAQILSEPFTVLYSNDDGTHKDIHIYHQPNEPLWSVNMKRAIASIFQMKEDDQIDEEHKTNEATIYGVCGVLYKVTKLENTQIIDKTLNYDTCEQVSNLHWGNVKSYGSHEPTKGEMERSYHYTKKNGQFVIGDIETTSNYTYQNMPDVRSTQQILQKQIFRLIERTKIGNLFDVSKNTEATTVLFEYPSDDDESFGRHVEEKKDKSQLIEEFISVFDEFKKQYQMAPLMNYDVNENQTITQMVEILSEMDKDSLNLLSEKVFVGNDDDQILMQQIFVSLIPYVGENGTVEFIKELVQADELNDLLIIKLLATFPIYATPSDELITEMEELMTVKVSNPAVKYAALMSYAALVAYNHRKGFVTIEKMKSYKNKYFKLYNAAEDFEERMAYLLGLLNLANGEDNLSLGFITQITCDANESRHLRALAMHSFAKLSFVEDNEGQLYKSFWAIVKNRTEAFEVRIAALEMMLTNVHLLSVEHFNNIIDSYMDRQIDPHEAHIQNYIFTKHLTLKHKEYYKIFMTDATDIKMKTMEHHVTDVTWATGNYFVGYTDEAKNFGDAVYAKLIANPVTNMMNVAEISYHSNAMSIDLGTYTVYVKLEGLIDVLYETFILNSRDNAEVAVPKLLELITKNKYKLKESPDLHIEIVLFMDNRALFGVTIDQHNIDSYSDNPLFEDLIKLIVSYDSASFPVMDFQYLVSELGTIIRVENDIKVVTSKDITNFIDIVADESSNHTFKYRYLWRNEMRLRSYNPVADMDILTYKILNSEKQVNFPFSINKENYALSWKSENDSFIMIEDHLLGTYADEEVEQYCPKCHKYNELTIRLTESFSFLEDFPIGVSAKITKSKYINDRLYGDDKPKNRFSDVFDLHRGHSKMFPLAKPFLYYCHVRDYFTYIVSDLARISIKIGSNIEEPLESTLEFEANLEELYNENDPIDGSEGNFSLALTNRKLSNAEQVSYLNVSYMFVSASKFNEENTKSHIENRDLVEFEVATNEIYKLCINREVLYPDRRPNKYSIVPVESAKGKTKISWGIMDDKTETCPKDKYIKISEIFSGTDDQTEKVKESKEYKTCKQESINLKYTPPTEACLAVFEMMSRYNLWQVYGDFRNAGQLAEVTANLKKSNYGVQLFEVEKHLDDTVNVTYSKDILKLIGDDQYNRVVSEEDSISFSEIFSMNPSNEAYDDSGVEIGIISTCFITPNYIKPFAGKSIENYEGDLGKELVALVECSNTTRVGVNVQKLNDKKVAFNLRSGENELTATINGDKLKIIFNGKVIKRNEFEQDESFKIYFLADDVIYVTDSILEVYYNTEYVLLKTISVYHTYVCGACTYQEEH